MLFKTPTRFINVHADTLKNISFDVYRGASQLMTVRSEGCWFSFHGDRRESLVLFSCWNRGLTQEFGPRISPESF